MSTYLVCVCVGEYEFVEGVTNNGVKVRVYTVPGKKNQADVALAAGGLSTLFLFRCLSLSLLPEKYEVTLVCS